MSPEMKEDSDCFLTVSFHIRLMRLWGQREKQPLISHSRPFSPENHVAVWGFDSSLHLRTRFSLLTTWSRSAKTYGHSENLTACNLRDRPRRTPFFSPPDSKSRSCRQILRSDLEIDLRVKIKDAIRDFWGQFNYTFSSVSLFQNAVYLPTKEIYFHSFKKSHCNAVSLLAALCSNTSDLKINTMPSYETLADLIAKL